MDVWDISSGPDTGPLHGLVWKKAFWNHLASHLSKLWHFCFRNPTISSNPGGGTSLNSHNVLYPSHLLVVQHIKDGRFLLQTPVEAKNELSENYKGDKTVSNYKC